MASRILDSLGTAGSQVGNSVLGVFGNKEAAAKAASTVETVVKEPGVFSKVGGGIKSALLWGPKNAVGGMTYIASRPFVWADAIGGKVIGGFGNFFAKNPKTALAGTAIAAGLGIGHVMNKRAERHAQDQINALEMAQLQQASIAQAQANTVTPADYAAMESRMRQGGQNGGFAAGIQAERAAQGVQGPAV